MNILNNKNKRTPIFKALALCLFAAVSLTAASCDDDMDIQQSYPFTVETMPVPNKVTSGQTVEIRCELKKTGDFANTLYTIRYFQFEGEGTLKMAGGITFLPVQWSRNSAKVQVSLIALPPPESSAASGCAIPAARRGCTCGQGWQPRFSRCAPFQPVRPVPYSETSCACPASPV